jgi:hypothetical protein
MATTPQIVRAQPGIKRDGTRFDGDFYTDGLWMRMQRGLPRKIGGYRSISKFLSEISRGFTNYTQQQFVYCHSGGATKLERFTLDSSKSSSIISDRTPVTLVADAQNRWMFDYAYDASALTTQVIAHVSPNGACSCNDTGGQIFAGDALGTSVLTEVTLPAGVNATGGVLMIHPYLFYYGTGGVVGWSVAGTPTDLSGAGSGAARPWGQKIIKGLPLRSSGTPAGVFWAYDAVIRATFSGGATVFQFDTVATDTSIMSAESVVDYDGVFYWAGVDRFLAYNGVVREVPNQMNLNWFFDGLNAQQRSKVFAFKVPRYGEIWWCFPRGDATECTHAIIFNVRENSWYDTALPSVGRVAGGYSNAYAAPILTDAGDAGTVKVWVHEQGVDMIDGQRIAPIESYFETCDISAVAKGQDASLRVETIEPDFIQSGDMTVNITGRVNARAPEVVGTTFTFPDDPNEPHEEIVLTKEQRRELRFRFGSNVVGGDYQAGQIIAHIGIADKKHL